MDFPSFSLPLFPRFPSGAPRHHGHQDPHGHVQAAAQSQVERAAHQLNLGHLATEKLWESMMEPTSNSSDSPSSNTHHGVLPEITTITITSGEW